MLLRESGRLAGLRVDPEKLFQAPPLSDADRLADFAEAVGQDDPSQLETARVRLVQSMGDAALVEASAVVAAFHALDRVADATGIRLDFGVDLATVGLRQSMGLDHFASAANSPMSGLRRGLARVIEPLTRTVLRWKT